MSNIDHEHVVLRDVTLRDGLQDETPISTSAKQAIWEALVAAGIQEAEVASFVRPDRVPAMADAEAVCATTKATSNVTRWGLVLNERGAQRALECGLRHLQFVVSVTDTHSRHNAGHSTADAIDGLTAVCELALDVDAAVEVTLACAFGCPYEHQVSPERVLDVAARCADAEASAIGLADTIGTAVPDEVSALVRRMDDWDVPIGVHLHDTRGLGIANALAAFDAGVRRFDGSVGALGGCPFAPGASGNIALEDLAHAFEASGIHTGTSITGLIEAARMACDAVGKPIGSHVGVSGPRFATS